MAKTTSLNFPNMFDVSRNSVGVLEDNPSVVNRTALLMMTEPTELYHSLDFGVGLRKHLFQYNNENQKAIIRDKITNQLRLHEPCVNPDKTTFSDGLLYTGTQDELNSPQQYNELKMTVGLSTKFGDEITVSQSDLLFKVVTYTTDTKRGIKYTVHQEA